MKSIAAVVPVVALAAGLSAAPVLGQTKDAKPQSPAPAASAEKRIELKQGAQPADRKRGRSLASVDARHCLELGTNMAIHRCAEKYRRR